MLWCRAEIVARGSAHQRAQERRCSLGFAPFTSSGLIVRRHLLAGLLVLGAAPLLVLACGLVEKRSSRVIPEEQPPTPAESFCRRAGLEYSAHHPQSDLMVRIPGGTFVTGTIPAERLGGNPAARFPHQVTINSFEMDRTEVTVTAYGTCVHAGACWVPETGDLCNWGKPDKSNHPVNCVTWYHASQYCCWAGKRLPSELEWEYAARGTDGRTYPWGNDPPERQLCWNRGDTGLGTCAVGSHALGASPHGLLDMAGNVWEWTSTADNEGHSTDSFIIRGGSWFFGAEWCFRVHVRGRSRSMEVIDDVGFRCAR